MSCSSKVIEMDENRSEAEEQAEASRIMNIINKAADKAVMTCFAVKYAIVIGMYMFLKHFVNDIASDFWIAFALAYAIYSYELVISALVKNSIINKITSENEDEASKKEESRQQDVEN